MKHHKIAKYTQMGIGWIGCVETIAGNWKEWRFGFKAQGIHGPKCVTHFVHSPRH